jgi:AcrR family transcriptional regulator
VTLRSPRADARDNRERLIRVGTEVLIAAGPGATVSEIVRRAEVSESLFFTHFASKDELIAELLATRLEVLRKLALHHLRRDEPALTRLEAYIWEAAEEVAPHRGYLEVTSYHEIEDPHAEKAAAALHGVVGRLVAAAAPDLRPGLSAPDVHALIMIGTLAAAPYRHARPELWRRYVGFLVAGIRKRA